MSQTWRQAISECFKKHTLSFELKNEKLLGVNNFASVALILVESEKGPGLLFIKRQDNPEDPWSGHMALPGGRTHVGEGPVETAVRETFEEIGLELDSTRFLMRPVEARARQSMASFMIYPCLFITNYNWSKLYSSLSPCPKEVESIHFFPIVDLLNSKFQSKVHWSMNGKDLALPSIQIGRQTIWGLTYWILELFFKEIEGVDLKNKEYIVDLQNWKNHPRY